MKIEIQPTDEGVSKLQLIIQPDDYEADVKKQLKKLRKQVHIPGFRPDKIPMSILQKKYGEPVKSEVISQLISQALNDYIKENNLEIFGQFVPLNEDQWETQLKSEAPVFEYEFAPVPEFEIPVDELKKVPLYDIEVADEAVDKYLEVQRELNGEWQKTDQIGDNTLLIYYILPQDGDQAKQVRSYVSLRAVKDNDKAMELARRLQKEQKIEIPYGELESLFQLENRHGQWKEAHQVEADTPVIVQFEDLQELIPAELNEELFEKLFPGQKIENEEALRQAIRDQIKKDYDQTAAKQYYDKLYQLLLEKTALEVPRDFIRRLHEHTDKDQKREDLEKILDGLVKEYKFDAILNKYFKDNNLQLTPEEIRKAAIEEAYYYLQNNGLLQFIQTEEQLAQIADNLMEENKSFRNNVIAVARVNKFFDHLRQTLQPEKVSIPYEEFQKITQPTLAAETTDNQN